MHLVGQQQAIPQRRSPSKSPLPLPLRPEARGLKGGVVLGSRRMRTKLDRTISTTTGGLHCTANSFRTRKWYEASSRSRAERTRSREARRPPAWESCALGGTNPISQDLCIYNILCCIFSGSAPGSPHAAGGQPARAPAIFAQASLQRVKNSCRARRRKLAQHL